MDTKTPRQILHEWVAAYKNRDPFALIELCADDDDAEVK